MPRTQRFGQYIQQVAYTQLFQTEERDERPDDVLARESDDVRQISAWSATSYSGYVPFRIYNSG
jgi:hypothetical protein